jgi:primosomal protein N' (replication factor Y)
MPDLVVDIAVGVSVNKTFHYRCPDAMQGRLVPGSRVLVPFGSRKLSGTVVGFPAMTPVEGLKSILEVIQPSLNPDLLELACWMSEYYIFPLGQTIEAVVPKAVSRARPRTRKYLVLSGHPLPSAEGAGVKRQPKGKKQAELMQLLAGQGETAIDLLTAFSRATIKSLVDAGIADIREREEAPAMPELDFTPPAPPELMREQHEAVRGITESIGEGGFAVFLLHGVTASGKTEVYLHAIRALPPGKGAIVLVPEIALTPQLLSRFRRRFGSRVAVLHSGLTDRERADEYRRIRSGQVDVAVGARSAVFAPFPDLGLIIVDEEHENSYKQEEGLRYHGRDVAVMRAKLKNAVVVLGSATPSLESYYNAQTGKYRYLRLANRVDHRPLPAVAIVDTKALPKNQLYTPQLLAGVAERLEKKEQTLLLLNRRGYSAVLVCRECGTAIRCPSCSVSLTFHKADATLKCHYCGFFTHPPDRCSCCHGSNLKPVGTGTQKIEEELRALFPKARMQRMDSDSVKGRDAYERLLGMVDRLEVDILLGTQMIAKGHDFPAVTLVGVVDADVALNLPDFRAGEKTFQLMTQAAGRAGRGDAGGQVIIQTLNPGHYSMIHSRTHDYDGFYRQEIAYREQLGYPPLGRMIRLEVKSSQEGHAQEAARAAQNHIRSLIKGNDVALLGPAPAPIARVRGQYRFQLLLLSKRRDAIRFLALAGRNAVEEKYGRTCRVIIDVDPVNLM